MKRFLHNELKLLKSAECQFKLNCPHTISEALPGACSADFPSSPLYDEVEVAFTSLPGGLTKELLIYGSPYCIQICFPQLPPGLK